MSADSRAAPLEMPPERDADLGRGQGGGVVDAVADHAGRAMAGVELGDRRDLVGRQEVGSLFADAQLAGHGGGRPGVVAGEHDGLKARARAARPAPGPPRAGAGRPAGSSPAGPSSPSGPRPCRPCFSA